MREVCFILVQDKILRVYFGSTTRIPDNRERWEIIWQHRNEITEIAHSHPGEFLDFSHEDLTTMKLSRPERENFLRGRSSQRRDSCPAKPVRITGAMIARGGWD